MDDQTASFNLSFSGFGSKAHSVALKCNQTAFVVGPNGAGKSALAQFITSQNFQNTHWVAAHRQVWFTSDSSDITASNRDQLDRQFQSQTRSPESRYKDQSAQQRSQAAVFDLVNSDNDYNRLVVGHMKAGDDELAQLLLAKQAPIDRLNRILRNSNLEVQISIENGRRLLATKKGFPPYGASALSDGERNALLIITHVLNARPGSLVIVDEPERHLHRSISSPLITALLEEREDCAFLIPTHDIELVRDHPDASAILLRRHDPTGPRWDADVLKEVGTIPSDFAEFILGTRRKILFVEGDASSLDTRLYSNLFPTASIIPVATCSAVERHVKALRSADSHHWTEAFGLIDGDNRDASEIADLADNHVAALSYYSVESLYYHPKVIEQLAIRQCRVTGGDASQLARDAKDSALKAANRARENFVSKSTSRRVRDLALRSCPSPNDVTTGPDGEISVQIRPVFDRELASFDALLSTSDYEGLITKYPVRESSAFSAIENALHFPKRGLYRSAVRLLVDEDNDTRTALLNATGKINDWLNG